MSEASQIDGPWFQGLLRDKRITQRKFAELLGTDPSSLALLFKGKRRMRADWAANIARILDVGVDEVLAHSGLATKSSGTVPILGHVAGDASVEMLDAPRGKTRPPSALLSDTVALVMRTSSGPLSYLDGWVAFCGPEEDVGPETVDRTCVVVTAEGDTLLRLVRRGSSAGAFTLSGFGVPTEYEVELTSARRVLLLRPV